MNPKQAEASLRYIIDNQKTVSISKIEDMLDVILNQNKMLAIDNRKLRKKIKRQRNRLRRLENERI